MPWVLVMAEKLDLSMNCEVLLLDNGLGELFDPVDFKELAFQSPGWAGEPRLDAVGEYDGIFLPPWGDVLVRRFRVQGGGPVWVGGRCETSMEVAWALIRAGALPSWGSVVAVEQKGGRGQLRRPWVSVPGNLHVSFALEVPPAPWDSLLSLVAGYIFSQALTELGESVRIKWPNDLYQHGRKVGGILVEQRGQDVVIGMGLNLAQAPGDHKMRSEAAARADILQLRPHGRSPLGVWLELVNRSKNAYKEILKHTSPSTFLSLVSERLLWLGHMIYHRQGTHWERARLVGLHQDGGLILDKNGNKSVVYSGSILFEQP